MSDPSEPMARPGAGRGTHQDPAWLLRWAFFSSVMMGALPLAIAALGVRMRRRRSPVIGLREKSSGDGSPLRHGQVLVHGVSLGEVNLMRPLVPRLERRLGTTCLLSSTTKTGCTQLAEVFPTHQRVFFPFDLPWAVRRFLSRSRPRLVVLLEFELWPLFLCACFARAIPVVVVNAKISERSFRRFKAAGSLTRPLFAALALVLVQNGQWGARLAALGVRRDALKVCGSLKADTVSCAEPAAARQVAATHGLRADQPVLLLASTSVLSGSGEPRGEEGVVLTGSLQAWRERGWQVVVCPRHPERGAALAEQLRALGTVPRRSALGERLDGAADQVLIVDQIGQLSALYAWCAAVQGIAVVGGSLGSARGGQNMLEAAAHGCCTVVGEDTRNFPDAMALLRAADAVVEASAPRLAQVLAQLADDAQRRGRLGVNARGVWSNARGAIERVVDALGARFSR